MLFCRFPWVVHVSMVSNFYRETSGASRAGAVFSTRSIGLLERVNLSSACSSMT